VARESSLWARLKDTGVPALLDKGFLVDLQRLENAVAAGHPDVEGCICWPFGNRGDQVWIELKSNERPKRGTTPIHPKTRESQSIWHRVRTDTGSRCHWVLLQVGSGHRAALYLIPGSLYDKLHVPESELARMSVVSPDASPADVLERAARGW
jgi:hypothetical protein